MRWQHPERGLLAPFHFLAAFEHPSLSVLLGDVAIRTAIAQMRDWRDAGFDVGYVAVNLATEQFAAGDLAERVRAVLDEHGVEPSRLMLEVTETVYLDRDAQQIVSTLRRLRDLGVRVALDDFGTGYASLSHLKTLPVDRLKIDRSFVHGLAQGTVDAAIVAAMLLLGKSLGVEVVAEGVETEAELAALRATGCERIQGFLFSRPLAPADAAGFMLRS